MLLGNTQGFGQLKSVKDNLVTLRALWGFRLLGRGLGIIGLNGLFLTLLCWWPIATVLGKQGLDLWLLGRKGQVERDEQRRREML
jgi:hypothetical protein